MSWGCCASSGSPSDRRADGAYTEPVSTATARWRVDALARRCYLGLDAATLRDEVLRGLRRIVSVDAAFFATVDPATMLYTSVLTEEPLFEARALFLDNEFGRADVNKFTELAAAADHVSSLDRATSGNRRFSPRYFEVMAPLGLGMSFGRRWSRPDAAGACCACTASTPRPDSAARRSRLSAAWSRTSPRACGVPSWRPR